MTTLTCPTPFDTTQDGGSRPSVVVAASAPTGTRFGRGRRRRIRRGGAILVDLLRHRSTPSEIVLGDIGEAHRSRRG